MKDLSLPVFHLAFIFLCKNNRFVQILRKLKKKNSFYMFILLNFLVSINYVFDWIALTLSGGYQNSSHICLVVQYTYAHTADPIKGTMCSVQQTHHANFL